MSPRFTQLTTSVPRLARRAVALTVVAALVAGCSATGRVVVPTAQPARLLDPTALPAPGGTAQPTPNGTAAPAPTAVPAARTLTIVGVVESVDGEIWVIDGLRVRVPASVAPGLGPGSLVRVSARVDDDDDDDESIVALSVAPVSETVIVGQVGALDATSISIDGRVLALPAGLVVPAGLAPGTIVRVVVDDDGGTLVVRVIEPQPEAQIIGGTVELIGDGFVVIGGRRLVLSPDVVLWRVRLVVGEPVRIIVVPVGGVLTIVTITIVTIVVPPPVVVVPIPEPTVVVVVPAPRPPRPAPPPPSNSDDDDDDD